MSSITELSVARARLDELIAQGSAIDPIMVAIARSRVSALEFDERTEQDPQPSFPSVNVSIQTSAGQVVVSTFPPKHGEHVLRPDAHLPESLGGIDARPGDKLDDSAQSRCIGVGIALSGTVEHGELRCAQASLESSAPTNGFLAAHEILDTETANAVRARCAERVRKIVLEVLNIPAGDARRQLADDASLTRQWKADSLDLADITMSVEDEFDISVPDAVAETIDSIDATVEHILKGKAS